MPKKKRVVKKDPNTGRFLPKVENTDDCVFTTQCQEVVSTEDSTGSQVVLDVGDIANSNLESSSEKTNGESKKMHPFTEYNVTQDSVSIQNAMDNFVTIGKTMKRIVSVNLTRLYITAGVFLCLKTSIDNVCENCYRESTTGYPLHFQSVHSSALRKRKFCRDFHENQEVVLCDDCLLYYNKPCWNHAWPSVLCTLFFSGDKYGCNGRYFFTLFPKSFTDSWAKVSCRFGYCNLETLPLFEDYTLIKKQFDQLVMSHRGHDLKHNLNNFSFPFIKCPVGCNTLINETGKISFVHLLNYLFPNFKSFGANKNYLRSMREDWLNSTLHLDTFLSSPCLSVDENGLALVTCYMHNKKIDKQIVHMAPSCFGNLFHVQVDRLAPMATKVRGYLPAKVGEFSHGFTISTSLGGQFGISCLQLTNKRCFNVKSDYLLPTLEPVIYANRQDVRNVVNLLYNDHSLNMDFIEYLKSSTCTLGREVLESFNESSNSLSMFAMLCVKKYLEENNDLKKPIPSSLLNCHNMNKTGLQPFLAARKHFNRRVSLFLLISWFINYEYFGFICLVDSRISSLLIQQLNGLHRTKSYCNSSTLNSLETSFRESFNLEDSSSIHLDFMTRILDTIDGCKVIYCPERKIINMLQFHSFVDNSESVNVVCIINQEDKSLRNFGIPEIIQIYNKQFQLVYLFATINDPILMRYGNEFFEWWCFDSKNNLVLDATTMCNCKCNFERSWKILLYLGDYTDIKPSVMSSIFGSGQDKIKCGYHEKLLSTDLSDSTYKCSITNCKRKSAYRCPETNCFTSVCNRHLKSLEDNKLHFLKCSENFENNDSYETLDMHRVIEDDENQLGIDYVLEGIQETGFDNQYSVQTETTSYLPEVELCRNAETIPIHLFFNDGLQVFRRLKKEPKIAKLLQRFLQNFAASQPDHTVSLIQPSALLCPSLFLIQNKDGSFGGAIPYFLYGDNTANAKLGFASFYEHVYSRITNIDIGASGNVKYLYFLIDALLNLHLHNSVTKNYFQRGIQNIEIKGEKLSSYCTKSNSFSVTDSERNVKELAQAMAQKCPTVFLTLTLNLKKHPGTAALVKAIDCLFPDKNSEEHRAAMQTFMPVMMRIWNFTVQIFLDYLINSSEKIIGDIENYWGRVEFQNNSGNPPHYHILLWLRDTLESIQNKIASTKKHLQSAFQDIFHSNLRLIDSEDELDEVFNLCVRIHTHDCSKAANRCKIKRDANGTPICRFPPYEQSNVFWLKDITVPYKKETLLLLEKLKLATPIDDFNYELDEHLTTNKFSYPADKGAHLMPTCPAVFAITQSSTNVLLITKIFSSRYLNKYAAGKEEHVITNLKPGKESNTWSVEEGTIENTKITAVNMRKEQMDNKKRQKVELKAVTISQTEQIWWSLKLPCIMSSFDFIHVPSVPMEKRQGIIQTYKYHANFVDKCIHLRENEQLEPHRLFKDNQKTIMQDAFTSSYSLDKVTIFSLRPPELLCVTTMKAYFTLFVREEKIKKLSQMKILLHKQPPVWIDGTNCVVRIRQSAMNQISQYIKDMETLNNEIAFSNLKHILTINDGNNITDHVSKNRLTSNTPVVVFSTVYPRQPINFLLHLLYSMGAFETELDLFHSSSLLDCFVKAKILPEGKLTEEDAHVLIRKYLFEQMIFIPGGNLSFSARLSDAFHHIMALVKNEFIHQPPAVLMAHLTENMEEAVQITIKESQERLFNRLTPLNLQNKPPVLPDLVTETWKPEINHLSIQSVESFNEQSNVINYIINALNAKIVAHDEMCQKHYVILGKPGAGKSHVTSVVTLYAMLNGLTCYVTSLASKRASNFNCEHIHRLFCLLANKKIKPQDQANSAVTRIIKDSKKHALLLSLDILVLEEIGLINAELLYVIDLIFQTLHDNDKPFGGVTIICNGDTNQLPAVTGTDTFLSPALLFNFNCFFLEHPVRMMDLEGQLVLDLMSRKPVPKDSIDLIISIIGRRCSFVSCWDDIQDCHIMKVFGKKKAEREAIEYHKKKILSSGKLAISIEAEDEMCVTKSSSWIPAAEEVKNFLDNEVREPRSLLLHEHCLLRITRNLEKLSQGQVCILAAVPQQNDRSILVFVPLDSSCLSDDNLWSEKTFLHWPTKRLYKTLGFVISYKNWTIRRKQYPVLNNAAMTCHKLMGDTFLNIASKLSVSDDAYSLWMASQLYVIVSRVKNLSNVIFVGSK